MTNTTIILSLLVTNLAQLDVTLPMTYANGELGVAGVKKEIGIIFSNQVARTTIRTPKGTNVHDVLLSSEVIGCERVLRNPPMATYFSGTNLYIFRYPPPITNWAFDPNRL